MRCSKTCCDRLRLTRPTHSLPMDVATFMTISDGVSTDVATKQTFACRIHCHCSFVVCQQPDSATLRPMPCVQVGNDMFVRSSLHGSRCSHSSMDPLIHGSQCIDPLIQIRPLRFIGLDSIGRTRNRVGSNAVSVSLVFIMVVGGLFLRMHRDFTTSVTSTRMNTELTT